jgi:D-arabinose 1-dehydrogenase-like Zn-dependent alcohol dehydrogenase
MARGSVIEGVAACRSRCGRDREGQGRAGERSRRSSIPDPGPGEVVVAMQACGVCHTDLHYREGGINDDFPFLLGHEAAGSSSRSAPA